MSRCKDRYVGGEKIGVWPQFLGLSEDETSPAQQKHMISGLSF